MKPMRPVITRSPQQAVGSVTLEWLQPESIHYQQKFERSAVYVMALIPGIKRIVHQPLKLNLDLPERTLYTPDFGIEFESGETAIIEVKPLKYIEAHTTIFNAAAKLLAKEGKTFHVLYEAQLSTGRTSTAEHFAFLANRMAPEEQLEQLEALVESMGKLTFKALEDRGYSLDMIGHAIGRRRLCMEPSLIRKPSSWVSTPHRCAGTHSPSYWLQAKPWGEEEVTLPPIDKFPLPTEQFLPKKKPARYF